ncbi:hypothetical protein [Paenibacillus sp.]
MARAMKLVCMDCSNEQVGMSDKDGQVCYKCRGCVKIVGWLDEQGMYVQKPKSHSIEINIKLSPWIQVLIESLPKAFEEAAKAGMPIELAHQECEEMVKRIISKAFTIS